MSEIRDVVRIAGDISILDRIGAVISDSERITASMNVPAFVSTYFDGQYTVTPAPEDQYLETQGLVMRENLKVEKIPSNYGLITWNGQYLTVS